MLAIILLVLGVLSRFILHMPNFTPVVAIALFSGFYLKKKQAIILPLALFFVTDLFIGMHNMMFFTWGSIALIALVGNSIKDEKKVSTIFGSSLASAFLFFLVTNFGVWMSSGMYPHTSEGIITCYIMAIPFFRSTIVSTLVYSFALFGLFELIASRVRGTKLAPVLLSK